MKTDVGPVSEVVFVMGTSKFAPVAGLTIPRIEMCAAVLATDNEHLELSPDNFVYHTDSMVFLGHINNRNRRFYTYVCNRVEIILKKCCPIQWQYVPLQCNPADIGTRPITTAEHLLDSMWIKGPTLLKEDLKVLAS